MALQVADLPRIFSRRTNDILRRSIFMEMFLNRSWESELQTNYAVKIPQQNEDATATSYTRGADWKTLEGYGVSQVEFAVDQHAETGVKIGREDQLESQLNLVARQIDINAYKMAKYIHDNLFVVLRDGVKNDTTHREEKTTDSTKYLTDESKVNDTTVKADVGARIEKMCLKMVSSEWIGRDAAVSKSPVMLLDPVVYTAFLAFLEDKDTVPEISKLSAFTQGSVAAPGLLSAMPQMSMNYRGVDIVATTMATHFNDSDSDPVYPILGFLPDSYATYARRAPITQMLTPETNQTGPWYALRQIVDFGRFILNDDRAFISYVRQGA